MASDESIVQCLVTIPMMYDTVQDQPYVSVQNTQNFKVVLEKSKKRCYTPNVICEGVRSIINFHSRNQDVDFDMLEMFFSFQCTKYDENRWLITKLFMRHNSPKKTIRLDMSANFLLRV